MSASWVFSCTPIDEKITNREGIELSFSADTLSFDTLFSTLPSVTKRLRVRNTAHEAVKISQIRLGAEEDSYFTLTVNGVKGKSFRDQVILGQDSILLLVEVNPEMNNTLSPFLLKDSIVFETNGTRQEVKLISWGQDAHFLKDSVIACNTTWLADKPYVIQRAVLVDSLCELRIAAGAQIYLEKDALFFVEGTLLSEGTPDNRVVFQQLRLEEAYKNIPGQWGGLVFLEGSRNNRLAYTTLRNANFGINLLGAKPEQSIDIQLSGCVMENMFNAGIIAVNANITAENTLVANCADYLAGHFGGGRYDYQHCTFANLGIGMFRDNASLLFSDRVMLNDGSELTQPLDIRFQNSIIYGNFDEEVLIESETHPLTFFQSHNLVKSQLPLWDGNASQRNEDPRFKNPIRFDYSLDTLSPAKDRAAPSTILLDLKGQARGAQPDMGAYERVEE
ncbi:right-handed parallel beta-helix repeat-containing protein [Cytophagales bacterium LB-30]|uniref:Right-handed parallel beta-helix repeat-containing protein n=1 Tax=Shiella aurantiaca TaxID=3058365 RepID=A0ABT8F5M2_9BACT|nr:right-handed parallel beta-helix repeat-containing protein [Shiella aurantiaca]MDN4165569.1 right-handed parallel beta-helix repeat-containing protein [Shiella aurantiaca]